MKIERSKVSTTKLETPWLEPCPFCGGAGEIKPEALGWVAVCRKCKTTTDWYVSRAAAVERWNKRFSTTEKAYNQINRSMRKLGYPVSTGWGIEGHVQIDVYSVPVRQKDAVQSKIFDLTHKYFIDTEFTGTDVHVQVYTKKETKSMGGPPQTAMNLKKGKG